MTAPVAASDTAGGDSATAGARADAPSGGGAPSAVRRWRWPVGLAVLALAVVSLGLIGLPRADEDFDPESAAPSGTRAVVAVLARHGVQVQVVRSVSGVDPGPGDTLLVARPALVPFDELARLAAAQDLVLIQPDAVVLDELGVPATSAGTARGRPLEAGCDQSDATAAGRVRAGGSLFRLDDRFDGAASGAGGTSWLCYPDPDRSDAGSLVVVESGGRRVSVIGQPDLLRNEYLAEHGNAALAVRLLGRQPRLQWYVPDPTELPTQEQVSLGELLPPWTRWLPWQLALALAVTMFWRGRRLGPLVGEPLPVVVRSAETQEGRARLYRQARARDRAASALRTATLRRLAARLQATDWAPDRLADRVAQLTGAHPARIRSVLVGPAPTDDRGLVALANRLMEIEQDVAGPPAGHRTGAPQDGR